MFAIARQSTTRFAFTRAFSAAPARNNAIHELYVKELKAFKPTPISTKDAESATRPWNTPVAPKAPALEVDAATQLSDYEAAEVEVQSNVAAEGAAPASDDWFVLEEPEDNHH